MSTDMYTRSKPLGVFSNGFLTIVHWLVVV
ncbi:hypothetical protein OIU76_008310 [Salix suchowensis]|nr:hypothetical protein OIU76_008310 [Salix suchowensis]